MPPGQHPRNIPGVAEETGVSVAALNGIVAGVDLIGRATWEPLTQLAIAQGRKAPHPAIIGLALAVADLPREYRRDALRRDTPPGSGVTPNRLGEIADQAESVRGSRRSLIVPRQWG